MKTKYRFMCIAGGGALVVALVLTLSKKEIETPQVIQVPVSPRKRETSLPIAGNNGKEAEKPIEIDAGYQKLIEQGAISAPVKVDPNAPIGTVFTS